MRSLISNYSFDPALRTVTLLDFSSIELERVLLITNVTRNKIIYNFADPQLGGSVSGNSVILNTDTSGMLSTDKLQIFYETTDAGVERVQSPPWIDTTTNLPADGVFTGQARDTRDFGSVHAYYGVFRVASVSDKQGMLWIQESNDGTTWMVRTTAGANAISDVDGSTKYVIFVEHRITMRYVRLVYKNTDVDATTLLAISSRLIGM
jgi:hypothetical protein